MSSKKKTVRKTKLVAGTPKQIRDLVAKFDGNVSNAARSMGKAASYIHGRNKPGVGYPADVIEIAQAVLDGQPLPAKQTAADNPDNAFKLGICIVVAKASQFERLYDIGTAMGGVWLFKMSAGPNWIGVMRLVGDKLKTYVKVAEFDALRIAAP